MSLGDLYRHNKFSLIGDLNPDGFRRPDHPHDQRVEIWAMYLEQMRQAWEEGEATEVETDFFEYFEPEDKPARWPDWLTK